MQLPRVLVSLSLAATQLLSWSAPAAYVCFAADGRACGVEFGASECGCCTQTPERNACCVGQAAPCRAGVQALAASADRGACDCFHLPLMASQGAAIHRAPLEWGASALPLHTALPAAFIPAALPAAADRGAKASAPPWGRMAALSTRAGVVLRC